MTYVMESDREGQRIEAKTDRQLLIKQLSWVGIKGKRKILDLGCAAGTTCRILKEILGENSKITGIDVSEMRINEARAISDNVEYRIGNAEALPAQNNEFDVSWSRFTFEYLKNPLQALREMTRVTKKGGIVAVADIDGNCFWHYPITTEYEKNLTEAILFLGESGFDPFIGRKLYSLFKQAGLKNIVVDIRPYHKIAGRIAPEVEELWKFKLKTIAANLIKMGWDENKAQKIIKDYLHLLRDENTFTYSVLISVKGQKDG